MVLIRIVLARLAVVRIKRRILGKGSLFEGKLGYEIEGKIYIVKKKGE